jgi:CubicO group peptidase (beta-lactamase class C family)
MLGFALFSLAQMPRSINPASEQLKLWLAAYDSDNWDVYREFLRTHLASRADNMFQDRSLRNQTGAFDLLKIENETATTVTALLYGRDSDKIGRIAIEVEAAEPHRILGIHAQAIARPAELSLPRLSEAELVSSLRGRIEKAVSADEFSGAVLIAKNGKPIFTHAYGLADREHDVPNSLNTRFRIGSMNKVFTAVAILQLVSMGKLKLHDPLGKYLTDYPNKELASKVTISHLLSHTGGTGDFFGPEFDRHRLELRTHEDYINLYGRRPVKFDPGSRFEYSNYGFLILGALIDKVSGQSYYDYVRDHIYNPAGMTSTGSEPEDEKVPNRSVGYTKVGGNGGWHRNTLFLPYRGTSAGGGYTTVEDLLRFANVLGEHKLLDATYTNVLTTGKVNSGGTERYAYGFEDHTFNGLHCFGHGGGSPGMNGDLQVCPESGYTVIALANMDPPAATRIAEFGLNRLPIAKPVP